MSLARAFFGAGAAAVVGTLDRARDDEAGVFFSATYRALARGISLGDAVATAKRDGIRSGAPPAAWADVVVLGDAEVHPRAREPVALLPLALGAVILSVVGVGVGHRKWRRRKTTRG